MSLGDNVGVCFSTGNPVRVLSATPAAFVSVRKHLIGLAQLSGRPHNEAGSGSQSVQRPASSPYCISGPSLARRGVLTLSMIRTWFCGPPSEAMKVNRASQRYPVIPKWLATHPGSLRSVKVNLMTSPSLSLHSLSPGRIHKHQLSPEELGAELKEPHCSCACFRPDQ